MRAIRLILMVVLFVLAQVPVFAQDATPVPLPTTSRGMQPLVRALAGLEIDLLAGAGADTNIAVTGITSADTIKAAFMVEPANSTDATMFTDITAEIRIQSAGNIQVNTTVTTGHQILLIWYDHDAYSLGQ